MKNEDFERQMREKSKIIWWVSLCLFLIGIIIAALTVSGCSVGDPGFVVTNPESEIQIVDADGDIITIDSATGVITNIEYEHYEIHEGDSFTCWYEQDVSDTGDKTIIAFKTSDTTKWLHMTMQASSTVIAEAMILEAPTITDNAGDNLTVYNRNRNSTEVSTIIDTSQNPDVSGQATFFTEITMGNVTGGVELAHAHIGTGTGPKTTGGLARAIEEFILKQDTLYVFVVESLNAEDNTHFITLNWYEHTNR